MMGLVRVSEAVATLGASAFSKSTHALRLADSDASHYITPARFKSGQRDLFAQRSRRVLVPKAWKAQMLPLHHTRLIKRSGMLTTQPGGNLKVLWNLQPEPLDFIEL